MTTATKTKLKVFPLADRVAIRPMEETQEMKGGLYIPDTAKEKPIQGEVIAVGSGSFSLEIGGPRTPPGERSGVPDHAWCRRIQDHLEQQRIAELIAEATPAQLWRAGNAGGELLNWIAMLGVIGAHKPCFIAPQDHGHAFAAYRWK